MSEKIPTAFGLVTPASVPPAVFAAGSWAEAIHQRLLDRMFEQSRMWSRMAGIDPDNRPTVMEERDLPDEYLAARKRFKRRWKKLTEEGLKQGWLEHEHCYECGGELNVATNTTEWVDVPNPAFDPDKPNPYAHLESGAVTIPTIGGTR